MSDFLSETLGVADSGVAWDVGNIKLWQSTRDDIVLFTIKQPQLVKNPNDRYDLAVTTYLQQQADKSYKTTGGSAIFTVTSAPQYDEQAFQEAQDAWRKTMGNAYKDVKFVPLNTQKAAATVLIDPLVGKPDQAHNDKDIGTPGGTNSFLIELTELGAQTWAQGIKEKTAIPAGLKLEYEYLRMMPDVGAVVTVHGTRAFTHFSTALNVAGTDGWFGGSADIDAAWEEMQRDGTVEITFIGGGLSPELEKIREELTLTFAQQAREQLFAMLFVPKPDIDPAKAGDTKGAMLGINFALKWRSEKDAIDIKQTIKFQGMTWLKASMDISLATLFADTDTSYLTEVQTQQAFPVSLVIDGNQLLSRASVATTFSEGHAPEVSDFASSGGTDRFVVSSLHPDAVNVAYTAKINYTSPRWPIIETRGMSTVANGGNQIVIKPGSWVGRHQIHMLVRDGKKILSPSSLSADDYLTLNVSYSAPYLKEAIRDAAQLSGKEIIDFNYPLDPLGQAKGEARISALGVVNGNFVQAKDQAIDPDEIAVFILVTIDGNVQIVSQNALLAEDDELAQNLLAGGGRPIVEIAQSSDSGDTTAQKNTGDVSSTDVSSLNDEYMTSPDPRHIEGTAVALEYNTEGAILWVEEESYERTPVRLRDISASFVFEHDHRHVEVVMDATETYADRILIDLGPKEDMLSVTTTDTNGTDVALLNDGGVDTAEMNSGNGADIPSMNGGNGTLASHQFTGTTMALEYTEEEPTLWIAEESGEQRAIRLRSLKASYPFEKVRKRVKVTTDAAGIYAHCILVELAVE